MVLGLYFTNKAGCGEECPGGDIFAVNTRSSNIVPREDSHGEGLDVGVQPSTVSIHSQADDDDTVSIILEVGAVYLDMAAVVGEMCVQIFFLIFSTQLSSNSGLRPHREVWGGQIPRETMLWHP